MLFLYSAMAWYTTPNIQPTSSFISNRLYRSPGSLPRSKTIGNCGCRIGWSMPSAWRNTALTLRHFDDMSEPSGPKNRSVSRPVFSLRPSKNADASTPSIGRSVGTLSDAPASAANVLYQSCAESISSVTTPAATLLGQRTMAGTRIEPSQGGVKKPPRNGPLDPPRAFSTLIIPAPLSLEKMMIVLLP